MKNQIAPLQRVACTLRPGLRAGLGLLALFSWMGFSVEADTCPAAMASMSRLVTAAL